MKKIKVWMKEDGISISPYAYHDLFEFVEIESKVLKFYISSPRTIDVPDLVINFENFAYYERIKV
jgi:hypothetical protein